MTPVQHPRSLPRSHDFSVSVNGVDMEVFHTDVADFALCMLDPGDFPARVEVTPRYPADSAAIHPRARQIAASLENGRTIFDLRQPGSFSVAIPGNKTLYLFANPPESAPPDVRDPSVITVPAGQVTEIPLLSLEDGQTLYLPAGAVLKGRIHIKGKTGIRICGCGIFDGSFYSREAGEAVPSIVLERCPGVLVEDITMIRPQAWMLVLAACAGATVRNIKQIGEVMSSDGIDVLGSRDVLIENCFLHNNDDCVAIKAFELGSRNVADVQIDARENVENVLVQNCTFANWHAGNAMEIGHELSSARVRNVTFRNIDVLHVHGTGAVFSIHNCDRALVEDVLFETIRVEHCYDKFIDFRITRSRFSTDTERGFIRRIALRDIDWRRDPVNEGYTISLIGGWDDTHAIEDVSLENIRLNGVPVRFLDELEIHTRHTHDLRMVEGSGTLTSSPAA